MIYLTSDMHFNHANILAYCKRPWLQDGDYDYKTKRWASQEIKEARAEEMNEVLIANWNSVVSEGDTVYHLGDFSFSRGSSEPPQFWEDKLNGKIVHIKGNHDRSRSLDALECAMFKTRAFNFFLIHRPPHRVEEIPDFCDVVLCGHVHEKWDHIWVGDVPVVNVGIDVRDFKPINLNQINSVVAKIKKER